MRQSSIASSCYAAGGVPLAFTQEDFLVVVSNRVSCLLCLSEGLFALHCCLSIIYRTQSSQDDRQSPFTDDQGKINKIRNVRPLFPRRLDAALITCLRLNGFFPNRRLAKFLSIVFDRSYSRGNMEKQRCPLPSPHHPLFPSVNRIRLRCKLEAWCSFI